jgi:hypothetical protein
MALTITSRPLDLPEISAIAKFLQVATPHLQGIPQTPFIIPVPSP